MNLGLIGLLGMLQIANPNSSVPYDSSKAIAEEVASYLMENGQKELILSDSSEDYIRCWAQKRPNGRGALEFRLCKAYLPQNPTNKSLWFLELTLYRSGSIQVVIYDREVRGKASMCNVIREKTVTNIPEKECNNFYHMLISAFRNSFKKEGNRSD